MLNKDLLQIIRSNAELDETQKRALRQELDMHKSDLDTFRSAIKDLQRKIQMAEEAITFRSTILEAPIRRLPPEILSITFLLASIDDYIDFHQHISHEEKWVPASLAIIQVCKHWRDVALQTTGMWQHFVAVDNRANTFHASAWDSFSRIFESKLTHLELRLIDQPSLASSSLPESYERLLHPWCDMLRSLRIRGINSEIDRALASKPVYPALEELYIEWHAGYTGRNTVAEINLSIDVPRLKRLHLCDARLGSTTKIPWAQLAHLSLFAENRCLEPDINSIFDILRAVPNLEGLHIGHLNSRIFHRLQMDAIRALPVTMARLRVLEIHDIGMELLSSPSLWDSGFQSSFLHGLSTPALEKLDIIVIYDPSSLQAGIRAFEQSCPYVSSFIQRAPKLSSVRVVSAPISLFRPQIGPKGVEIEKTFAQHRSWGNSKWILEVAQHMLSMAGYNSPRAWLSKFTKPLCFQDKKRFHWARSNIVETSNFIDRVLGKEDPYFQRSTQPDLPAGPVMLFNSHYFLEFTRLACFEILGTKPGVVDGHREVTFIWEA